MFYIDKSKPKFKIEAGIWINFKTNLYEGSDGNKQYFHTGNYVIPIPSTKASKILSKSKLKKAISCFNKDYKKRLNPPEKKFEIKFPKIRVGYIYIYKMNGFYKIGKTKTPLERKEKYITENPLPIDVILEVNVSNYDKIEKEIQEKFSHKKHNREWFELNENDIIEIKKILESNKV